MRNIPLASAHAPFFAGIMLTGYKWTTPRLLTATTYEAAHAEAWKLARETPNCIGFNVMAKTPRGAIRPVHTDD